MILIVVISPFHFLKSSGAAWRCSPRCAAGRHNAPRTQFALVEIALFILGTPTDLKEICCLILLLNKQNLHRSFHQY